MTKPQQTREPEASRVALFALCLGMAQSAMTLSSIQIALPDIARELEASAIMLSWVPMSFLLVNACLILPMGRFADAVGRKRIYLLGIALFGIANLLASLAASMGWLLVCRAAQGLSTAMLHATSLAMVTSLYPGKGRTAALGLAASTGYLGLSLGPPLGGFLTEYLGWRSVFALQVPLSVLNLLLVSRTVKGEWRSDEALPVDWAGTAWLAAGLSCLAVAVSVSPQGGGQLTQLLLLLAGLLLLWLFFRHLSYSSKPLIRLQAIRGNAPFVSALSSAFLVYAANYTMVFLLSLYLQFLLGLTPSQAGLTVLIQTLVISVVSLLVGRFASGRRNLSLVSLGAALVAVSFALLSFTSVDTPLYWIIVAMLINGVGMGLFTAPNNSSAMGAIPADRLSAASAVLNLARYLGNMLGTAVVLSLMATLIGQQEIQAGNHAQLEQVVRFAFCFALLSASLASISSYRTQRQARG